MPWGKVGCSGSSGSVGSVGPVCPESGNPDVWDALGSVASAEQATIPIKLNKAINKNITVLYK